MKKIIKIGNAQAFWGDNADAPSTLLLQQPDLDYLTLDYLSEVSLSIMAVQRAKDPAMGYARDFVDVIKSLAPAWQKGSQVKVIANAGGLEPRRCAAACAETLRKNGCRPLRIAITSGDNVLPLIKKDPGSRLFNNLESGAPISQIFDRLQSANAYMGAQGIVSALQQGADIVITGRVTDPSLSVGPCIAAFGWSMKDYDCLAQATIAGHLIECGTQVTGGISTDWLDIPDPANLGFPFVEVAADGSFIITKPEASSGRVNIETIKEQLLYEIGDPDAYLSPDVTVSFLSLTLATQGNNRIAVKGAKGRAPPPMYKVSATYNDGYKAEGSLAIYGRNARRKAQRCGEAILDKVQQAGYDLERSCIECIGTGDVVPGLPVERHADAADECLLRISAADHRMAALEYFVKQLAPMVTSGPPGTTGYTGGRPPIRQVFGYWPCLVNPEAIVPYVEFVEA
jgi:hypothetical protein